MGEQGPESAQEQILEEFELDGQPASVIRAATDSISEEDMDLLLKNLIQTNFKLKEDVPMAKHRHSIRNIVHRARTRMKGLPIVGGIADGKLAERLQQLIYPDYSWSEHIAGSKNAMRWLAGSGNLFAVKIGDKTVAVQGVRQLKGTIEGRPVFELAKASTLPEYRRKGLAQRLALTAFREKMSQEPESLWISMSRNKDLLEGIRAKGGHVYDILDETSKPSRLMRETNGDYTKTLVDGGYKVIFFDPKVDQITF